jgi:hypothetical protein
MNTNNLLMLANVASQQLYVATSEFAPLPVTKNKDWHSAAHYESRERISREIYAILKSRRPNANDCWSLKLPTMCQRLECNLYENANSFDEYSCSSTMRIRLQNIAKEWGKNMTYKKNM